MLNIMKKWFFLQKKQSAIPGEVPAVFPEPATRAVMADSDEQQCVHGEILCRHLLEGMAVIEIIRNSLLDSGTWLAGSRALWMKSRCITVKHAATCRSCAVCWMISVSTRIKGLITHKS